ncbi:MAG: tRNA (N6-threonylcarbamoyladenosine(37)-N6)-methyltransferase TrmO [Clostridia bacterium]|nr:tRNA (N6-threonylcarbamoyladenosine(37)-N6)-methyltransferase TrmO [Clostridia bacterium]
MEIRPVAHIRTDFCDKFGIPRQSGRVKSLEARIVFEPEFRDPEALREIEGFSHLWLIFDFSKAHRDEWSPTVRPPRLGGNRRVGVFASRSPFRPNSLGLSSVRLVRVESTEKDGKVLVVAGADLLDGTPIYDVKPYLPFADSHPEAVGGYADGEAEHRLEVSDPAGFLRVMPERKRTAAEECIAEDPRPSYQDDPERIYGMNFAGYDIRFRVTGEKAEIASAERKNTDIKK